MSTNNPAPGLSLKADGVEFCVWSPFADAVAITGDFNNWAEEGTPLEKRAGDNWSILIEGARPGQEYKYLITKSGKTFERNDPRCLQLNASGDNSVITDPDFDWQDDNFVPPPKNQQVIYELHVGTFNRPDLATPGTFADTMEKLDYLSDLGVNMIEILPVSANNMQQWWGYEPTFIFAIETAYGGRQAFLELVRAAHQRNIGVIVDVVYNHLSPEEKFGLWDFDGWHEGKYGGIYFYNDWRAETPWGPRPDYGRPEVRNYIVDNVKMWLKDCHVDGLRLDAVFAIRNAKGWDNDPEHDIAEGWQLLQEINQAAHKAKKTAIIIAEDVACNESIVRPLKQAGAGFDAQWETTFPESLRQILRLATDDERKLQPLVEALQHSYDNQAFGRVIYSESHDADANGHARLNQEISSNAHDVFARRRSLLAAVITLTAPGIPMLFQGQEFMESGWFNHYDGLNWQNAKDFKGIVKFYKHLIALRLNEYGLTAGLGSETCEILNLDEDSKLLAYSRSGNDNKAVVVILNFRNQAIDDYQINLPANGLWRVRLNSDWSGYSPDFTDTKSKDIETNDKSGQISIGPYSALILSQD